MWLEENYLSLIWKVGAEKLVYGEYGKSKESGKIVYRSFIIGIRKQ